MPGMAFACGFERVPDQARGLWERTADPTGTAPTAIETGMAHVTIVAPGQAEDLNLALSEALDTAPSRAVLAMHRKSPSTVTPARGLARGHSIPARVPAIARARRQARAVHGMPPHLRIQTRIGT